VTTPFLTPAFDAYIQPARAKPQIWRLVVGLMVFFIIYIGFVICVTTFTRMLGWVGMTDADMNLNTRPSMTEGLFTFAGGLLGIWVVVKLLHGRKFATLLGPKTSALAPRSGVWRNFAIAAAVVFAVQASWMVATALYLGAVPNQPLMMVLVFLPLGALLLLVQTGAEELLFRGYLMQQLAARFKSPVIWIVLPSVVFGLIHYDPATMGDMVWYIIVALTVSGLVWADLTRITGNIGAAWGWHFMNNFMLLNFMTLPETLTGFAWKLTPFGTSDMTPLDMLPDIGVSVAIWLVLRRLLRPATHGTVVHVNT